MWGLVFFLLPAVGYVYICWHTWHILPMNNAARWCVIALMVACLAIFFCNFFFGLDNKPMTVAETLYEMGNSTIFIALYVAMLFILLDLGRLVHLVPESFLNNSWAGTLTVVTVIAALFVYGNVNYNRKVRVPITVKTDKNIARPMKIVMVSDLHLGYHNRKTEFNRWIDLINREQADLILIGGDIIDGSIRAIREQGMDKDFHRLNAPVYACLGNHEFYSNKIAAETFYRDAGINLLVDSTITVNGITIIGRDDRANAGRKTLAEVAKGMPKNQFSILLDHQPYHLEEAEHTGVDFQFSGHTHYGQVWPISWIEDAIYEDAFGPLTKGRTQYYVSSGIGIWGAKFRIGTRSEYVVLTITQ